jgi:hypothetical protein
MAGFKVRPMNGSLDSGSTDGKYRKVRPDTEVSDMKGHGQMMSERAALHPFWNYGPATAEAPSMVNSGK